MKNFIDNLTPLEEAGWKLEGKVAGIIVYEPEGGGTEILGNLSLTLNHMGVVVPPYGLIYYRNKTDQWVLKDLKLLARSMGQQIKAQKREGFSW